MRIHIFALWTAGFSLAVGASLAQTIAQGDLVEYSTPVGAREVQPAQLWPYRAKWEWRQLDTDQQSESFGALIPNGALEERFSRDENGDWRHIQTHDRPDGTVVEQVRRLDGATLQPLRVSMTATPAVSGYTNISTVYRQHAYRGEATRADGGAEAFTSQVAVPAFSAWIGGVVIRSLPLEIGYRASLPTTLALSQTNYKMWIEVVGEDVIESPDGEPVEVWLVETGFLDLNTNDIYRQGAEGRGGVFHIVKNGGPDIPLVANYISSQTEIFWTE